MPFVSLGLLLVIVMAVWYLKRLDDDSSKQPLLDFADRFLNETAIAQDDAVFASPFVQGNLGNETVRIRRFPGSRGTPPLLIIQKRSEKTPNLQVCRQGLFGSIFNRAPETYSDMEALDFGNPSATLYVDQGQSSSLDERQREALRFLTSRPNFCRLSRQGGELSISFAATVLDRIPEDQLQPLRDSLSQI